MFQEHNPGQIVVTIEETDNGIPTRTGEILSVGSFDGDTITTDPAGEWVEIDMQDVTLNGEQVYAIVVDAIESEPLGIVIGWRSDKIEGYSKGSAYILIPDGSWYKISRDFMFEIYGS